MNDDFKGYVMFKPDGTDTIWVTVHEFSWGLNAEAFNNNGQWSFDSDPAPNDPPPEAPEVDPFEHSDSSTLPEWSQRLQATLPPPPLYEYPLEE